MAKQFKNGDFVQLKSGGPKMTVSRTREYDGYYECKWFAGSKLNQGFFAPDELQTHEDADKAKK
jgi:uncharacterized protein YodC (DUF2158 family)